MKAVSSRDLRGVQYKGRNLAGQNFSNSKTGHKSLQKILLFALGLAAVITISALSFLQADLLNSFVIIPLTNSEISHLAILVYLGLAIYLFALIRVATLGFEIKIISSLIITILVGSTLSIFEQKNGIGSELLLLGLSTTLAYLGAIALGFCISFLSISNQYFGKAAAIFAAAASALFLPILALVFDGDEQRSLVVVVAPIAVVVVGEIVARQATKGLLRLSWIRSRAVFRAATGGTTFYGANLTDVCFDGSDLRHADFRKANIIRTSFRNATGLHLARLQGTILEDERVRELLITGSGYAKDFTDADLQGANLREADLREAVLVGARLLDADLSHANLTDACIQDWNINHNTRFTGVECKRVYLKRSPSGHFLEPKPDSGEFLPGEFEKWVTDIRDTIDLIFQNGLNWRAFAFSLTQTAIDHNGLDLSVRSIENKGDGVVVAKVGVSLETNKTAIHHQMTGHYQEAMGAIEAGYELALRAKDEEIDRLTQFYDRQEKFIQGLVTGIAETKGQVLIQGEGNRVYLMDQAGDIMESNQNVNAGGNVDLSSGAQVSIGGDMSGSTVNLGNLSGQVSNTIQQLHDIKTGETEKLVQILEKLQQAIESDLVLTPDQKQQALEAVSTLAEEGKKPPEQRTVKFCTMAMNALKGLTSTLTDASKLAEAAKLLLPTLAGIFGL